MGMATSKVRLNICGSSYVVNTSESEDYMKNLADRLNLDMNELMASSNSVSITTAAVMTALNYRDELEKASGSADNMRRQIKDYLEDAASAKMAAEEARRENASLKRRVDELERRLRRNQFPAEDELSRPEILAPAGNREMLGAAVFSGADAVYLGLTGFNARRTAGNFTPDELREAVVFCHARGVKVHVTLNTLVYDRELSGLADAVRAVAAAGADAVIADDLATAQLVKSIAPTLHLHGSTQMSVHTPEGAKELAALGYDRVILARELSLEEIRAVCEASPIEVEVFVHGALCMSVSGQCMMSAFLGGRSGNRGACAGPCRLPFDASAGLKPGQPGRACHLSLKDMDYIPHLRELMDAGVASVKIEGRLRTPEYAAAVVAACRAVCAGQPYDEKLVRDIFSRSGFTDGYLTNRNDGKMFGVRTEADAAATRAATPKARELFRRELQRVPVHYELSGGVEDGGVKLTARDDDGHRVSVYSADEPQPAQKDPLPGIERALGKTGGTPFVMDGLAAEPGEGGFGFLPGAGLERAAPRGAGQAAGKAQRGHAPRRTGV